MFNDPPLSPDAVPELSLPDLVRECGRQLTDPLLWNTFHDRLQRSIFLNVYRAIRIFDIEEDRVALALDLSQEVYARLLANGGKSLAGFHGQSDLSVYLFIGKVVLRTVTDHVRKTQARRRVIPFGRLRTAEGRRSGEIGGATTRLLADGLSAGLVWHDIETVLMADPDRRNAARNRLVFKLFYVDGLRASDIAALPGFGLSTAGVEAVLERQRRRLRSGGRDS